MRHMASYNLLISTIDTYTALYITHTIIIAGDIVAVESVQIGVVIYDVSLLVGL